MFQRPRGTRDFSPADMCRRLALEKLCDEQAARYGFMRVATPTFDVTPAELIHGIITEKGVAIYPFKESLEEQRNAN